MPALRRKKFGEIGIEKGYFTQRELEEALREQKEYLEKHNLQKKIGAILLEKGVLDGDEVNAILREQGKTRFWAFVGAFINLFNLDR